MTSLNMALWGCPKVIGNGVKSEVQDSLGDWIQLMKTLAVQPTSVHKLVATSIDYYGYCELRHMPLNSALDPFV